MPCPPWPPHSRDGPILRVALAEVWRPPGGRKGGLARFACRAVGHATAKKLSASPGSQPPASLPLAQEASLPPPFR
eukprot:scaffold23875_cov90-Isochrysis_galbana.AAC.1